MSVFLVVNISVAKVLEEVDVVIARVFTRGGRGTPQRNKYAGVVVQVTVWHSCQVDAGMEKGANTFCAF